MVIHIDIREKLADIKSKKLSAVHNVEQFLTIIKKDNPRVNAVLSLNPHAIDDAKRVDEKIAHNQPVGRLAGLGIIIKANICVEGMNANCASETLENFTSPYDADVIVRIKKEDGIILGMANMDEFACGASGEKSAFGATDNPSAPGFVPGGSSSGSAASVAAGFCDIALGSDTGGSIRNPASHCGVFGVKPQYGRVSRYGLIDLSMSLDQIGPLCTDLYGCALMLEIIAGKSAHDSTTIDAPVDAYTASIKQQAQPHLRIGVSPDFEKLCVDKRIYKAVMDAIAHRLASLTQVSLPHIDLAIQTYYPLVYVEFFSGTRKFDGRKYGKKIEESCGDEVLRRILGGREISLAEHGGKYYRTSLAVKNAIVAEMAAAFQIVDVIILPTTPILPHKIGTSISVEADYAYDAFTCPANLAGICGGVVPIGTIDGIPVGLQVFAADEMKMFACMDEIVSKLAEKKVQ